MAGEEHLEWSPKRIAVEPAFDEFVGSFQDGIRVENLGLNLPPGCLNADYLFGNENVLAELKCLSENPREPYIIGKRLASAYRQCGFTGSELFGYLFRGELLKEAVRIKIASQEARTIIEAIKKANKQIRSTKRFLARPKSRGLVLLANDNNYGLTPRGAITVICKAFRILEKSDMHVDCIVYFTPNVYYDDGTSIAKHVWIPIYNVGSEDFADFVNVIGKSWGDFSEKFGDPYLMRSQDDDLPLSIAAASPIERFKR